MLDSHKHNCLSSSTGWPLTPVAQPFTWPPRAQLGPPASPSASATLPVVSWCLWPVLLRTPACFPDRPNRRKWAAQSIQGYALDLSWIWKHPLFWKSWPLNKLQSYTLNVWLRGLWESSLQSCPFFSQLPINLDHTTPEASENDLEKNQLVCIKTFLGSSIWTVENFLSLSFQNIHLAVFSARKWTIVMGIHCDDSLCVQRRGFARQRELLLCPRKGVTHCNSPRPSPIMLPFHTCLSLQMIFHSLLFPAQLHSESPLGHRCPWGRPDSPFPQPPVP